MSRILALADLHLSASGDKPMDVFGPVWAGHARRMADAWDARVRAEDVVLVPGDFSWARTLAEAAGDLSWIGSRPGRKILLKGNHDSWWSAVGQVRRALPPGCAALQNDALDVGVAVVVGARGWTAPDDPTASPEDLPIFRREVARLRASIADADARLPRDRPRIAMLHYPPWIKNRPPTEIVPILREAGVSVCVYGHLHGADHALAVTGERDGIRYELVAADAVDFAPVPIFPGLR